jgi:hypothetical protein
MGLYRLPKSNSGHPIYSGDRCLTHPSCWALGREQFYPLCGGALLVLWAGALIWPLISAGIDPNRLLLQLLFLLSACLCLCTAWLLLLSQKFRTEFAEEQKFQPKYKSYLRRGLLYIAIAAMVIATLNDIYHLAQL